MSDQPFDKVKSSKKQIIINNFLGGISWALGATIGFSLLLTVLGYIASQANLVPYIGIFVSNILTFVLQNNQYLQK